MSDTRYQLLVRMDPELAVRARIAAAPQGLSLNAFINQALENECERIEEEQANLRAGLVRTMVKGRLSWVPAKERALKDAST